MGESKLHTNQETTLMRFAKGWAYTTNLSEEQTLVDLPCKLPIPFGTHTVTLTNYIPPEQIFGGVLRFEALFQQVDIYIDGQLRESYGDAKIDEFLYPYYNATHYLVVNLLPEDFGKEIKIVIQSDELFVAELSLIRAPEIGKRGDFVIESLWDASANIFVIGLTLMVIILLVIVILYRYCKKQRVKKLLGMIFLSVFWLGFYISDSILLWEIFNYSPLYSAVNDLKYYILDSFLPIVTLIALQTVYRVRLIGWRRNLFLLHSGLYFLATILHMMKLCSINYFRPFFMILAILNFVILWKEIRPKLRNSDSKYFGIGTLCLMVGYFIDYIKYFLTLLPLSSDLLVFLQLSIPFMLFVGIALPIYCGFVLFEIVMLFVYEQQRLRLKILVDSLTGVYTRVALYEDAEYMQDKKTNHSYLAMIDIDNFKSINDTYGHAYGDSTLQVFGEILLAHCKYDKPYRLGGDEFCIFFHDDQEKFILRKLEEIKEDFSIRSKQITGKVGVTLSIGLARWEEREPFSILLHNADMALYQSKSRDKNCISIYEKEKL